MTKDDIECIVFDCDGVLVDVSESYYKTIAETACRVLAEDDAHARKPVSAPAGGVASVRIIERFKATGRFNDEIDLSCAIILAAAATARRADATYTDVVDDIICNAAPGGIESVMRYVQQSVADVSDVVKYMEHPSPGRDGRLCQIFDQIFFGPELYRQVRKTAHPDTKAPAMIDCDNVIITSGILDTLSSRFGRRISMVTGRGLLSVRYTLGPMLEWFDAKNSAFLEDEPRAHAKPNPARLDQCIRGMGCRRSIYVGDSVEDAIMARDASSDVVFCGITGTSSDPQGHRDLLAGAGAQIILDSVLDIPKALNLE